MATTEEVFRENLCEDPGFHNSPSESWMVFTQGQLMVPMETIIIYNSGITLSWGLHH